MKRMAMLGLAGLFMAGVVQAAGGPGTQTEVQYLEVGPELQDCMGVAPVKCMQVRPFGTEQWQLFHGGIDGFSHEEGRTYLLQVRQEKVENPPADASSLRWVLERVVSEKESLDRILQPFPAAEQGQVRWVIDVPALPDETSSKIELLPGKRMTVDCNRHWASSKIEMRTLEGWGYSYHVMPALGPIASTMMACPGTEPSEAFVSVGTLELQRYNSRLPIVFYAPDGVELRYRVWSAAEEDSVAEQR